MKGCRVKEETWFPAGTDQRLHFLWSGEAIITMTTWDQPSPKPRLSFVRSLDIEVQSPEDDVHGYLAGLKEFRLTRSMHLSCQNLGTGKQVAKISRTGEERLLMENDYVKTTALTAVIADIVIATENENIGPLPVFTE